MTHCQLHSYEDYGLLYFHSAILNAWFPFAEPSWFRMAAGAPTVTSIFQTAGRNKSRRAGVCLPTALAPLKWSEVKSLSRVQLFTTPWTVAYQAPLSMRFSRQESWSGLPLPTPNIAQYSSLKFIKSIIAMRGSQFIRKAVYLFEDMKLKINFNFLINNLGKIG